MPLAKPRRNSPTIVQQLNRLQAESVTHADDSARNSDAEAGRRVRIDPEHWHEVPEFAFQPATTAQNLRAAALPAAILLAWLLAAAMVLRRASRRLAEEL